MIDLPLKMQAALCPQPLTQIQDLQKFVRANGGKWSVLNYPTPPPDAPSQRRFTRRRRRRVDDVHDVRRAA